MKPETSNIPFMDSPVGRAERLQKPMMTGRMHDVHGSAALYALSAAWPYDMGACFKPRFQPKNCTN